jgi:hypothetical protein
MVTGVLVGLDLTSLRDDLLLFASSEPGNNTAGRDFASLSFAWLRLRLRYGKAQYEERRAFVLLVLSMAFERQ